MAVSISHFDLSEYVPLPWTSLFHYENNSILFERTVVEKKREWLVTEGLLTAPDMLPLAHITLQRVIVYLFRLTLKYAISISEMYAIGERGRDAGFEISDGSCPNPSSVPSIAGFCHATHNCFRGSGDLSEELCHR